MDQTTWADRIFGQGISVVIPLPGGGEFVVGERAGIPYPVAIAALVVLVLVLARR